MKRLILLVLTIGLGWSLVGGSWSQSVPPFDVDPQVWEDTADGATGSFLVLLRQQESAVALAEGAQDWIEQGNRVYFGLKNAAETSQPALKAVLDKIGVPYRSFWIVNMLAVDGTRQVVEALAKRQDVLRIESNRSFTVPLEMQQATSQPESPDTVEWNITKVRAPEVWAAGYTGQGSVVANADTGVYWLHSGLKPHYRGWNGTTADHNYNWWDAIHNDIGGGGNICGFSLSAPCDDHGHGTHTTGTQIGDDGSRIVGVAPGAKWIACRNMNGGVGRPESYIECLQFFIAPTNLAGQNADPSKRPDTVGNSYGCPSDELCTAASLHLAIEAVRAAGIFMAVSAGNDGSSCSSVSTPPALEAGVFTVGSTTSADAISSFSSLGPVTVDGSNRRKPDIVAPGSNITSTTKNGTYGSLSGTSMASPHVSGAVALLLSAVPALRGNVGFMENTLATYAVPKYTTQGCGGDTLTTRPNNTFGWGLLDVKAAFDYLMTLVFPPSQLSALALSGNQVNLTWQDNSGLEDGFKIERKAANEITWTEIGMVGTNETTYQDNNITCLTTYSYRVRTYLGSTLSDPSNESTLIINVCQLFMPVVSK